MNAVLQRLYWSPLTLPIRPALRRFRRSRLMPLHWRNVWRLFRILNFQYGYLRSVASETPLEHRLEPQPWYTYPAVEYLKQLDLRDKQVFEYGCGQSTLFFAQRAARVVSVEHDPEWFQTVGQRAPSNCVLILERE